MGQVDCLPQCRLLHVLIAPKLLSPWRTHMSKFALVYVLYYAIMVSCGVAENLSETFVAGLDDRTKCCLDTMPFHGKIS